MSRGDWSPAGSASRDLCCSRNHGSVVVETLWDQMESWKRTFPVTSRPLRVAHSGHPCVRWISGLSFSQKPTGVPVPTHRQRHLRNTQLHSCHENSKGSFHGPHRAEHETRPHLGAKHTHNTNTVHDDKAHQAALTAGRDGGGGDLHGMPRPPSTSEMR